MHSHYGGAICLWVALIDSVPQAEGTMPFPIRLISQLHRHVLAAKRLRTAEDWAQRELALPMKTTIFHLAKSALFAPLVLPSKVWLHDVIDEVQSEFCIVCSDVLWRRVLQVV